MQIKGVKAQGDILFIRRQSIPAGFSLTKDKSDKHILAHGEATGHIHAIMANRAKFFVPDRPGGSGGTATNGNGQITVGYLEMLDKPGEVTHQEHDTIKLPEKSIWEVRRQQEWSDAREPRRVAD